MPPDSAVTLASAEVDAGAVSMVDVHSTAGSAAPGHTAVQADAGTDL